MKTLSTRKHLLVMSVVAVWAAVAFACTVEDENPANPRNPRTDANAEGSINPAGEDAAPIGDPICAKYGGPDKAKQIANAIVARAAGDCRIGTPIAANAGDRQHFEECFAIMIQGAFQCPGISYVAGQTKDSRNEPCRSMQQAHQNLNLRLADYNAFLEAVAAEFTAANITKEDQTNVAPVFEGQKNSIVRQANQPTLHTHCTCAGNIVPNSNPPRQCAPIIPDAGPDVVQDTGVQDTGVQDAADGG